MSALEHLATFQSKVKRSRRLLARQILLNRSGDVPVTELEAIFELSFLNIFVSFENELLELLKLNMTMQRGSDGKVRSLFVAKNTVQAGKLLLGTSRYVQILPVEQMEKIARAFLKNGGPFSTLSVVHKQSIAECYAIRNHIAHRSVESKASFQKKVLSTAVLPRVSTSPGYYLRSNLTLNTNYFDHQVAAIGACLKHLVERT